LAKFFEDSLNEFAEYEKVSDAATKLGLASMDEALPSMKVKLMPHQVIGVAWMLDVERNAKRKGGILADSMGLGKTIQMVSGATFDDARTKNANA
jgi:SNF2 family DNA or RNA helicase